MKFIFRAFAPAAIVIGLFTSIFARAVSETDLPGHSLFLHIKQFAAPFPGPGNYTIDFAATGHSYSIIATGAITSASGTWSFRQGDINGSVVITLNNYFGDGTGADIVLLLSQYYELYAGTSNQDGNWSLAHFVQDPIILTDLVDLTAPEHGFVNFTVSLLNGTTGVTIQWFKGGVLIPGANTTTLTLTALDKSMEGFYSYQVSKGSDTNVSRAARLTVAPAELATFNDQTFVIVLTNNASAPGTLAPDTTNAFRLKSPSAIAWKDGELTFLADYNGNGTNKSKTGTGLFAVSNGVPRKLVLTGDIMPGTTSPYFGIGGFNDPSQGRFHFYAVAKSSGGVLDYAILEWTGSAAVSRVPSKSTIPGNTSQQFQYFGAPGGVGVDSAFPGYGPGGAAGIYQISNNTAVLLLDNNTVLPGFPAPVLNLDVSVLAAGDSQKRLLAVRERNTGVIGAFLRSTNGTFESVIGTNTFYPGTTQLLNQIGGVAPARLGNLNAFVLNDAAGLTYLVSADAQGLHAVIKSGDSLPMGRANVRSINRMGLTDRGIVFEADTEDGRTGVYLSHDGQITTVMDTLSLVGTNIVSSVRYRSSSTTNIVLSISLYPSGAAGTAVNIGPTPSVPLQLDGKSGHFGGDGHFSVALSGPSGKTVTLEYSADLINWETVATDVITNGPLTIADPNLRPGQAGGFYRAKTAQP